MGKWSDLLGCSSTQGCAELLLSHSGGCCVGCNSYTTTQFVHSGICKLHVNGHLRLQRTTIGQHKLPKQTYIDKTIFCSLFQQLLRHLLPWWMLTQKIKGQIVLGSRMALHRRSCKEQSSLWGCVERTKQNSNPNIPCQMLPRTEIKKTNQEIMTKNNK